MTLGSLFDGSGGFPLAGALAGIEPVWAAEVEPYPIAVTRSRFPMMQHLGSVTGVHGDKVQPVDVITFGSPCQDLSVAGKRAGIHDGQRSNLFFEAIRIIKEMREATNGRYPAFAVWENVPGAFSSNKGEDFRCVLEEFTKINEGGYTVPRPANGKWMGAGEIVGDGFSAAWRVLDAQYWGVPQRRRRIYLVADFAGGRAGKILFERESLRGHPAQGGAPGQGAPADTAGRAGRSCETGVIVLQGNNVDRPDKANCNGKGWKEDVCYTLNTIDRPAICFKAGQSAKARSIGASETVTPTLGSEAGGNSVPAVCYPKVFHTLTAVNARNIESAQQPNCVCYPQVARTLTAEADASPCIDRGQNFVCVQNTGYGWWNQEDIAETLRTPAGGDSTKANLVVECYDARGNGDGIHCPTLTGDHENRVTDYTALCIGHGEPNSITMAEQANTLTCMHDQQAVLTDGKPPRRYIIRRLTPLECNRLQGFPDGWGIHDHKDSLMTGEEFVFWMNVYMTHARINGKKPRAHTAKTLTQWYNGLHTDSAEYKMWGNGIALPCAEYVMEGIAEELKEAAQCTKA